MAIPRLITKTDVSGFHPVTSNGAAISASAESILAFVRGRARDDGRRLFAEPVEGGTTRSWYGEGSGEPVPIDDLPVAAKDAAEASLRRALAGLDPLLDDREMGPLLRRALVVPSRQSVIALDDSVVLTDWGFGPAGLGDEPAALARQVRMVLGPYSARLAAVTEDFFTEQPSGSPLAAASAPPPATASRPSAAARAAGSAASGGIALPPASNQGPARSMWLVPLFAGVAAVFLALGFWLAWTHFVKDLAGRQFQASLGDDKAARLALQTQRDTNAALERELANARRSLESANVCTPEAPAGIMPPSPERQPITPGTVPAPAPQRQGEAPAPFNGSLASLLEHATAWIVVQTSNGIGSGTGFFVTTDTIITNAHVVQDATDKKVFVTSKAIGRVIPGQVTAMTVGPDGKVTIGNADFALIRLPETVPGAQPLAFHEKVEKLTEVVAAGYPAAIIRQEDAVRELQQGHLAGAPELVLTRGSISSTQQLANGLTILPHSADISAGNSGGPLVDWCGSVLGINTFVTASGRFVDRTKYALRSDAVVQWLTQQNVTVQRREQPCQPAAIPPTASAAPPGAAVAPPAVSAPSTPASPATPAGGTGTPAATGK
jgi:S1-C subfamily serine protease